MRKEYTRTGLLILVLACGLAAAAEDEATALKPVDYGVRLDVVRSGFDKEQCWVHARAGAIPGEPPTVVMTMQRLDLSGSDVFFALHTLRTKDLDGHWTEPKKMAAFTRRKEPDGKETVVCDFTPKWHAATKTLLGTGHTAQYRGKHLAKDRERTAVYAVYEPEKKTFNAWRVLEMPHVDPPEQDPFYNYGAGSTQRYDLPNGEVLLPVYHKAKGAKHYSSSVLRCGFDGETLRFIEAGEPVSVPIKRGLYEPSVTAFQGRVFMTLRNDDNGYVAVSGDGLHFSTPKIWRFDDGEPLGNYNTQQHWVAHPDALFLVYTRKGADNDHVFRHRAPLFIGRVDPGRLCIVRDTERVLVPERGARLGNFGVTRVSPDETWVTAAEWMQPRGCEQYGSDNSVYAARIEWK